MKRIIDYYNEYEEDDRLTKDRSHRLEFITTTAVLDPLLDPGSSILDVGAGTGAYSLHYGAAGHTVVALEPVPKNLDILRARLGHSQLSQSITPVPGDGRDLSFLEAGRFDVVLCMGPLYHLPEQEDQLRCIGECVRVLRRGGILAITYVSKCAAYVYQVARNSKAPSSVMGILESGAEFGDERDIFHFLSPSEISSMIRRQNLDQVEHVSTDGIAALFPDVVNGLDDEEYAAWVKYHLATCRDPSLLGYSLHGLLVSRKN